MFICKTINMQFTIRQDIITGVGKLHIKSNVVYVEIYIVTPTMGYLWILGISSCGIQGWD